MTDQLPAVPEELTWPEPIAATAATVTAGASPPASRSRWRRAYLGGAQDPRWARPALLAILGLSAVLYCWNLTGNGYANEFYAAAVQSGTKSWSAMFFGSLDSGNFITVDKPPFALWVMEASTRIFGFSSLAMLAPIALCGVAAVGVLYSAVRRTFGHAAASVAALVMALTPITVAINRDNNPDPVLVLLMTLAAWFTLEALRTKRLRHLLWAAVILGCAFNTKMLQAYIAVPALVLVYLFAAEGGFWRRIRHLTIFTGVLAAASFWWMLIVDAIPASSRPYIGGSSTNSVWDLVIGYNGLGRITGNELGNGGGFGGGGGGPSFSGSSGLGRLFNDILGTQVSWLLPAAALLGIAALVLRGRAPRTDPVRASLLLWGLWLAVHFVVFSYQQGTMHPYYVTTMGPALGALVGGGGAVVWQRMHERNWAWLVIPVAVGISALWSIALLHRAAYATWLVPIIALAAVVAVAALVAVRLRPRQRARLGAVSLAALLIAGLAGPAAFAAAAANSTVNGTNPLAGPSNGSMGGFGGGFGGGARFGRDGFSRGDFGGQGAPGGLAGELPSFGGGSGGGAPFGLPGQGMPGQGGQGGQTGDFPGLPSAGSGGSGKIGGFPGGLGGAQLSSALLGYLEANQGSAKWLVAVSNSNSAASIELQTGRSVISMWGFTGSDPAMTAAKLQQLVASGELKFVMLSGGGMGGGGFGGPGGGNSASSQVQTWVARHCTAVAASVYGGSTSSSGGSSSGSSSSTASTSSSGLYSCTASAATSSSASGSTA
jgi:4-amino-4-deoxy-L-arabinose transferase-like glycosyltransferase